MSLPRALPNQANIEKTNQDVVEFGIPPMLLRMDVSPCSVLLVVLGDAMRHGRPFDRLMPLDPLKY